MYFGSFYKILHNLYGNPVIVFKDMLNFIPGWNTQYAYKLERYVLVNWAEWLTSWADPRMFEPYCGQIFSSEEGW